MIAYLTLGTNDIQRAAGFYDKLLAPLGAKRVTETDRYIAWSASPSSPALMVIKPHDGKPATVSNGAMVALGATSREQVDTVYKLAMTMGAKDEGAAGPRGDSFYGGYFRDLDGNKLVVCCFG
jgi:catechol 2,3-dioxygenase-like lactoylglutathione lyase family enzyme